MTPTINNPLRGSSAERPSRELWREIFDRYVRTVFNEWWLEFPPGYTANNLANLLDRYLELAFQRVQARLDGRQHTVLAFTLTRTTMLARFSDTELWEQEDFNKFVLPLYEDIDLQNVDSRLQPVLKKGSSLHLTGREIKQVIALNSGRLRGDTRSLKVRRGEELAEMAAEIKSIWHVQHELIRTLPELLKMFPQYKVLALLQKPEFEKDAQMLSHPDEYRKFGIIAKDILRKKWNEPTLSDETFKSHASAHRKWKREQARG